MNLNYEKRALLNFLTIYFSAVLIVIFSFTYLFYKIEIETYKDNIFNDLREDAFKIASLAIDAHMKKEIFKVPKNIEYMLLNKNQEFIDGSFKENLNLYRDFFIENGNAYYVSKGAKDHLGISYIVVKKKDFNIYKNDILYKSFFISSIAILFLIFVGLYLGKMFLKPMKEKIIELDNFIKDSTHELNTPITSILLATKKIEKGEIKSSYIKALNIAARKISKIYEDMSYISFNHIQKEELKILNLTKIIEKNINFFTLFIEQKSITIEKKIDDCYIKADEKHIDLLIKNLIENSIKYSNNNSKIFINLEKCIFSITNRGKTIKKENFLKIFKRYERDESSKGGFGIGLDIVNDICKRYNFKIYLTSKKGLTTFYIYFKNN